MSDPHVLDAVAALLRSPLNAADLPPALQTELLLRGAILTLQQDGSETAIRILAQTVLEGHAEPVRALALDALDSLSQADNSDAAAALYSLYITHACDPAREIILRHNIPSPSPDDELLFGLLSGQSQRLDDSDPDYEKLSRAFLAQNTALQDRLLLAATRLQLSRWHTLLQAIREPTTERLTELVNQFAGFLPKERGLTVDLLSEQAADGDIALQETLCRLYLRCDDASAGKIALENGYLPHAPVERALFLFLTEQWRAYETLDFNHRLLITAYENADNRTRKRLLDLSRRSGQMEWFQSLSGGTRTRWLHDLSDLDWENTITRLKTAGRKEELWRLAQLVSPVWSARILLSLSKEGWQPVQADEQSIFTHLISLAKEALDSPLSIRPKHAFNLSGMEQYTAMAVSPDGNFIAFGSSTNAIPIWRISGTPAQFSIVHGVAPQTRSLIFSPDGEFLVTGVADHTLRVYRWKESKASSALEGHTGLVRSMSVTPDGRTLYSASFDGSIRAWRFPHGPALKVIHQSGGEIFGIALGPDARTIASAGADTDIQVLQLPDGRPVHSLSGHQATIISLAAAPRSDIIASYSRDRSIRVWNTLSARQLSVIDDIPEVVTALCIHPEEEMLAAAGLKGNITLYNISTSLPLYEIAAHRSAIIGLAFAPDGGQLISASVDGAVSIWGLEIHQITRQPLETFTIQRAADIEKMLRSSKTAQPDKNWLEFVLEMLRWKQRFDVQIEGPQIISVGDFDIQIG